MARDADGGAAISLRKEQYTKLLKKFPEFKPYDEAWRFKRDDPKATIDIGLRKFSMKAMEFLYETFKAEGSQMGDRWLMGQLASHIKVIKSSGGAKIEQLRSLEPAIISWVKKEIIHGWVFMKMESMKTFQACQVQNAYYVPKVTRKEYEHPAHVVMRVGYWSRGSISNKTFSWYAKDCIGKTVNELLAAEGVYHETPELVEEYNIAEKQFGEWRKMLGEQFVGHGIFEAKGKGRYDRASDSEMKGTRLIVDDKCEDIETMNESSLFLAHTSDDELDDDAAEAMDAAAQEAKSAEQRENDEKAAEKYARLPIAHFIWCFNLSSYNEGWVHMGDIKPYIYRPELRDKLILSEEHAELIDTLTADMDVLMEDVISGKSGGTAILCQGVAGTGKTLTAEIYSEVIKRPLYRVHSGQLGTNSGTVETELKKALDNAMRWRAVLLIDEADVFISMRGDDLEKNAVIGVFLRVLEYYNGLLFLTTNRVDQIDEAILSRCIAIIKFTVPSAAERERLWIILADVFGLDVVKDKKMAKDLAATFECTGRDIKGLVKLVTKFQRQRQKAATLADFKRLAAFKGLAIAKGK